MKKWYAVYTKPNSEHLVQHRFLIDGIETYLPEIEVRQANKGVKTIPLFPCYLFARFDLENILPAQWKWTPGMRHIVSFDSSPVAIPDTVINLIQKNLRASLPPGGQRASSLKTGDVVRITQGPFADLLAIFERERSSSDRVQVLLNFLGRLSRIELNGASVKKAPPGTKVQAPRRTRGRGRPINSHASGPEEI